MPYENEVKDILMFCLFCNKCWVCEYQEKGDIYHCPKLKGDKHEENEIEEKK